MCWKHQQFHECVARVKLIIFSVHEMPNFWPFAFLIIFICLCLLSLSVAWPNGVQLLVCFCSSIPVMLFDTPGISRCRSQHVVSVESSSLFHHSIHLWFICFPWWSIDGLGNLHADRTTVCFELWQKPRARLGSRKTGLSPAVIFNFSWPFQGGASIVVHIYLLSYL